MIIAMSKRAEKGLIVEVFQAGRFTATKNHWLTMLEGHEREFAPDRIRLTEANTAAARMAIREFAQRRGYEVAQAAGDGPGESAILVRCRTLRVRHAASLLLTKLVLKQGRTAPIHAMTVRCEHLATGKSDRAKAAHLPAHLDDEWQATVHQAASEGLTGGRFTSIAFDANRDVRLRRNRAWIKKTWPRMRLAWRTLPVLGTFGRRVIDLVLVGEGMRIWRRARRTQGYPGFDHVGVHFVLRHR